jgi:hypothetical protein
MADQQGNGAPSKPKTMIVDKKFKPEDLRGIVNSCG